MKYALDVQTDVDEYLFPDGRKIFLQFRTQFSGEQMTAPRLSSADENKATAIGHSEVWS
jgi:hypothetical protein